MIRQRCSECLEIIDIASRKSIDHFTLSEGRKKVRIRGMIPDPLHRFVIMLVKSAPIASEVEEGVAFYGRSGTALMKALKRLIAKHEIGTLEIGKLADFAVLDRDLFDEGAGVRGLGEAADAVAEFVQRIGFEPVLLGSLAAGKSLQAGSHVFGAALTRDALLRSVGRAS